MRNANIKYWLTYILLIIFFVLGALFYRQPFMALIILLLCVIPILSAAILFIFGKKINLSISKHSYSVESGNDINLTLTVRNNSIFPFLNLELYFTFSNLFYPSGTPQIMSMYGRAKKDTQFNITFNTSKSGMMDINLTKLDITDFLHFFTISIPLNELVHIPVYPKQISREYNMTFPESFDDEEEADNQTSGSMSREIKDMREYIPGDLLRDIHWKISAKKDDLFIKLYENSAVRMLYLVPELSRDSLEDTLETLDSFAKYLVSKKEAFKILAFNISSFEFEEIFIGSNDDLEAALLKLYYCPSYEMKAAAFNAFHNQYSDDKTAIQILGKEVSL